MHHLSSVSLASQPLHVSDIFVAHHQEVYCIYKTNGTCFAFQLTVCWPAVNWQSTVKHNTYQLLYIQSIPPDDGLQICLKHVEVDWSKKLRINAASSWFLLHRYVEIHYKQNIKLLFSLVILSDSKISDIFHLPAISRSCLWRCDFRSWQQQWSRLFTDFVGLSPADGMDFRLVCLLCVMWVAAPATSW